MCGRYYLDTLPELLLSHFGVPAPVGYKASWNIAPTQHAPVMRRHGTRHEMALLRWGLVPFWAKDTSIASKLINARSDGVAEKPSFRAAFRTRRCVVPATGYFEWKAEAGGKSPYAFVPTEQPCFGLAGIWETWTAPDGGVLETYALITTDANETVAPVHDRMPVILAPSQFGDWIAATPSAALPMMRPSPNEWLRWFPVSKRVNSARNDDASLVLAT